MRLFNGTVYVNEKVETDRSIWNIHQQSAHRLTVGGSALRQEVAVQDYETTLQECIARGILVEAYPLEVVFGGFNQEAKSAK